MEGSFPEAGLRDDLRHISCVLATAKMASIRRILCYYIGFGSKSVGDSGFLLVD